MSKYGRSRSMDKRLEAQRKPRAESKNAPVTEEHRAMVKDFLRECKYCNSGRLYECDTAKMLRELAEANHE